MNARILMPLRLTLASLGTFCAVSIAGQAWGVLTFTLASGIVLSLAILAIRRKERLRVARIGRDIHRLGGVYVDRSLAPPPRFIRGIHNLLLNPVDQIVHVDLAGAPVADKDLSFLKELEFLRSLDLSSTAISDALFQELRPLRHLQILRLSNTQLSDEACEWIARCTNLRQVDLSSTSVSDVGQQKLKTLSLLQMLSLENTLVSRAQQNGNNKPDNTAESESRSIGVKPRIVVS